MSIKVPRTLITPEIAKLIQSLLCFTPLQPFSLQKGYDAPTPEPILFYQIEKENIYLPFTVGRRLFPPSPKTEKLVQPVSFKGTLKPHQVSIIKEATDHLNSHQTAFLAVYPGCGKTVMALRLSTSLPVPESKPLTMILYHRLVLERQWLDTIQKFSDTSAWIVGNSFPAAPCGIILCKETQFHKLPKDLLAKIGILIIDEAHSFCTPSRVSSLLGSQPEYVIALSATPERPDGMHVMMDSIIGLEKVVRESKKDHQVIRFLTKIVPEVHKNRQGRLDWAKLVKTLCTHPLRNEYLFSMISLFSDYKIAVLTWSYDHAVYLHSELEKRGESVAILAGNRKFYSDSSILIGTVQKIGTGFDEQAACPDFAGERINLLILMGTTKSEPLIEQMLGRAFRTEYQPKIVVFVDEVGTAKSHWSVIKKWCDNHHGEFFDLLPPINGNWPEMRPMSKRRSRKKDGTNEKDGERKKEEEEVDDNSLIQKQLVQFLTSTSASDSDDE